MLATLHDTIDAANVTYEYQWLQDGLEISGATTADLDESVTARDYPYVYNVRVTNNLTGCSAQSEDYYVYVDANPVVVVSASDTDVCENGVVTLTAHLGNYNTPNLVYVWKVDGDTIPGATEATYVATIDDTHTYTANVRQVNSDCRAEGDITITKHDVPTVAVAIGTVTDTTICDGGQVTLVATTTADAELGEIIYTWYENGTLLEGVTGDTYTVSPQAMGADSTVYTYSVVASADAPACVSVPATATVKVFAQPVITIHGHHTVCEGTTNVSLMAHIQTSLTIDDNAAYRTWFRDGVPVGSFHGMWTPAIDGYYCTYQVATPVINEPHTFSFELDFGNGCHVVSDEFEVTVLPKPQAYILVDDVDSTICKGGEITATVALANPNATDIVYT